jgi:hypothetical protein
LIYLLMKHLQTTAGCTTLGQVACHTGCLAIPSFKTGPNLTVEVQKSHVMVPRCHDVMIAKLASLFAND